MRETTHQIEARAERVQQEIRDYVRNQMRNEMPVGAIQWLEVSNRVQRVCALTATYMEFGVDEITLEDMSSGELRGTIVDMTARIANLIVNPPKQQFDEMKWVYDQCVRIGEMKDPEDQSEEASFIWNLLIDAYKAIEWDEVAA